MSWFPICISLIPINEIDKCLSRNNVYNIESMSIHHKGTPRIRVKGSDKMQFTLILDWMLVNATLIVRMNLSPYPNFCKAEKTKSQATLSKIFIQVI